MLKFSNVIFVYKKVWIMIMNDAKIFLLDDKQEIINMIEPVLRKEGYENIFSANNITTAEKQYIYPFLSSSKGALPCASLSALISFNSSSAYLFAATGTSVYSPFLTSSSPSLLYHHKQQKPSFRWTFSTC